MIENFPDSSGIAVKVNSILAAPEDLSLIALVIIGTVPSDALKLK